VLVVVAAIGVGVGLLMHGSSAPKTPTPSAAPPPAVSSTAPTAVPAASPQAVPPSAPGAARPPLVTGPDNSFKHVVCDEGFTLPGQTGFATHSGRGSHTTGCLLARNVLTEYWAQYGNAGPQPRTVSARGAADCQKVAGAACDGAKFVMQCQQNAGDSWITCTGGFDARVYLW
jgi:serine/threonine-protein kinase